jgi:LacI family transcriptional regulator
MGAEYFLARCFKHFGFCGFEDVFWSEVRSQVFTNRITSAGFSVSNYRIMRDRKQFSWESGQKMLADWLLSLPKPAAVMACNDDCADHVLEAAKLAGIYVPEQLAVLGVSNDDLVCEFSDPPLSSIVFNSQQAGYNTAVLLDQLMAHKKPTSTIIDVKPIRVIERRSTDFLAIEDKAVVQAVDYIKKNSSNIVQVEAVAEHVGVSLRVLQNRFHEVMGFTLREELRRARLEHITSLLLDTNLSVEQIAAMSGYSTTYNLIRFFKDETGLSPGQFRKANLGA